LPITDGAILALAILHDEALTVAIMAVGLSVAVTQITVSTAFSIALLAYYLA
jgi:hypothetical protein